ncbi:predicted protein [Histoplasma capsulatum G186AR]|uniref:Uncharacterized protein n=1 Tax=Ajellomyces capsulatus (strain G186AR / H82 / ATCC MYA-2454 / RMSCC 2432) TaxID=447093 RepID=C0NBT7_AJECG|nr:uncharacterized protein HCBG_00583 [Histoplasma capsulatum G186AR]EEH11128.1 predicted protein [Histoplasma capsulatum G186AR]
MAPFRSQNGLRRTQILANQDLLADRHHSTCDAGTTYSVRLCGMAMHCPTWRLSKESRMGLLRQPRCQIMTVAGSRKTKSKKQQKKKTKTKTVTGQEKALLMPPNNNTLYTWGSREF